MIGCGCEICVVFQRHGLAVCVVLGGIASPDPLLGMDVSVGPALQGFA